jgi:putative DNA primase/helicase
MPHDDATLQVAPLNVIGAAVRSLAEIEDPVRFDRVRKVVMAEHGLSAKAVDESVERERTRKAAAESGPPLSHEEAQAEIVRLSKLEPLAYERERDGAAARIRVPVTRLDGLVRRERGEEDTGQGRPVELEEPEPWEDPVDGAALLQNITEEIRRYIVMSEDEARAVSTWIVGAYAMDAFYIFPRLIITAPEKGSGKSTLLDVIETLVPKAIKADNITMSPLFRLISMSRPTVLLDECDRYLRNDTNAEMISVINAGHKRNGFVARAQAIFGLRGHGDLRHRAGPRNGGVRLAERITIIRRPPRRHPREQLHSTGAVGPEILMHLVFPRPAQRDDDRPVFDRARQIFNRQADNWRPLIAIADAAGATAVIRDGWRTNLKRSRATLGPRWGRPASRSLPTKSLRSCDREERVMAARALASVGETAPRRTNRTTFNRSAHV